MLFNSIEFLLFLPLVFFLYWFAFKRLRWQNLFVLIASYIFYGWWDWRFLLLIALTSFCSYASGILLERNEDSRKIQRIINASNIVLNLTVLGIFKYFNFFVDNLDALFRVFGLQLDWVTINIVLPVGISFYTFQALSYTIDVYHHKIKATHDPIEFFAFISFFPQLVAGPIERATNLLPQFQKERSFNYEKAVDGCRQMLWGFFKKMVIADNCALIVNEVWGGQFLDKPGFMLLIGAVLFTFQIYCDFSGYSDIAIGCACLFGFNLMRNFNFPYFSRSIPEFWRRWHISLTTWFTDYIYIPLGGSRCVKWKVIRNIFIVWGISGLWHGANWTFVCWGLYHAFLLSIYYLLGINTKQKNIVAYGKIFPSTSEFLKMGLTFMLAVIGWVIFRAESIKDAFSYLSQMFSTSIFDVTGSLSGLKGFRLSVIVPAILFLLVAEWIHRDRQHALQLAGNNFLTRNIVARYVLYMTLIMVILVFGGTQSEFIYFQF